MDKKNDWDFSEISNDFTLVEDFEILDTGEFEIIDLDKEIEDQKNDKESSVVEDFESIFEENDKVKSTEANVIEPSTLIEEKLNIETSKEDTDILSTSTAEEETESEGSIEAGSHEVSETEEISSSKTLASDKSIEGQEEAGVKREKQDEGGEEIMVGNFKVEELNGVLNSLLEVSPDFEAAAIVSTEGFVIASVLPSGTSDEKVGAMSAAILSLGERAASELGKGNLETVFVEGESGYLILTSVTDDVLLMLSTSKYAKLGLVFYELSNVKKALLEYLQR